MRYRLEGELREQGGLTAPSEGYTSEERSSDQDDWYRSYSDGWFYDD